MRSARRAAPQAGSGHPRLEREWRLGSHSDRIGCHDYRPGM